jgi:hypothetical protein
MYYVLFFKSTKAEVKGTVVDGYPVEKRFTPKHLLSADVLFVFDEYINEYQWPVF